MPDGEICSRKRVAHCVCIEQSLPSRALHSGQQRRGRDTSEFYISTTTCFKGTKEQFQAATLEDEEPRIVREVVQSGWKTSTITYTAGLLERD